VVVLREVRTVVADLFLVAVVSGAGLALVWNQYRNGPGSSVIAAESALPVPKPVGSAARDLDPTYPDPGPGDVLAPGPRACYVEQGHALNRQKAPPLGYLRALHVQLTLRTFAALAAGIIHDGGGCANERQSPAAHENDGHDEAELSCPRSGHRASVHAAVLA